MVFAVLLISSPKNIIKNDLYILFINIYVSYKMKNISLSKSSPVILIDTSYFIFYRYFSTLKWYQYQVKDIKYDEITNDAVFMEAFYKHVLQDFKKLCKQWKTNLGQIILCCDCSRDRIWRNKYHDNYKGLRVQSVTFNPSIFLKFYEYVESNQKDWGLDLLTYDQLEADDIVYLVKNKIQANQETIKIVVITNDNDYLQIQDETTVIHNMTGKGLNLSKRSCGDPKKDLKIKLIMGDKSDNINSIHKGIGPKTALKLSELPDDEFEAYLIKNNCMENYKKNKIMVDFSEIPTELIDAFQETYDLIWT